MNTTDYRNFYSELGNLLYAAADIDQVISQSGKKVFYKTFHNEPVPAETPKDGFGVATAFYAEIEFDFLDNAIIDCETKLQSFIDYIDDQKQLIDQRMRNACFRLAEKLAQNYYEKNEKERELLDKLENKLYNHFPVEYQVEYKPGIRIQ